MKRDLASANYAIDSGQFLDRPTVSAAVTSDPETPILADGSRAPTWGFVLNSDATMSNFFVDKQTGGVQRTGQWIRGDGFIQMDFCAGFEAPSAEAPAVYPECRDQLNRYWERKLELLRADDVDDDGNYDRLFIRVLRTYVINNSGLSFDEILSSGDPDHISQNLTRVVSLWNVNFYEPIEPFNLADADADNVLDADDAFPLDFRDSVDSDGDGVGDNADAFPLDPNESVDSDLDGIGNNQDEDDDDDGVLDSEDWFPLDASESVDTDYDGVGNNEDFDDDGDGAPDLIDIDPLSPIRSGDNDGDGIDDRRDDDDDNDGVADSDDRFPFDASESVDTDNDGVGNNADEDDDGDGTPDALDAFPFDASEFMDSDGDGIGNNADTDDDNDGVSDRDEVDLGTLPTVADTDSDGILDGGDDFPTDSSRVRQPWAAGAAEFNLALGSMVISEDPNGYTSYLKPYGSAEPALARNLATEQFPLQIDHGARLFFGVSNAIGPTAELSVVLSGVRVSDGSSISYESESSVVGGINRQTQYGVIDVPALPDFEVSQIDLKLLTEGVPVSIPWARFATWQTSSSDDLLDADGDSLTVLNADGTPGSAFAYGICGTDDVMEGYEPYCGTYPEGAAIQWETTPFEEGGTDFALELTFADQVEAQTDYNFGYFSVQAAQPIDLSAYQTTGALILDVKPSQELIDLGGFFYNVFCTWPCGTSYLYYSTSEFAADEWRQVFPLSDLASQGLDLSKIDQE